MTQNLKRAAAYRDLSREFLYPKKKELQSQYSQIFGHALSSDCSPYETSYGMSHVFEQTWVLADVSGFYKAFGVEPSESGHERADHLSMELEFMAYLALKEAHALKTGRTEQAQLCLDAQKKFLQEHLGRWAGAFAGSLKKKPYPHYQRLAQSLEEFIRQDCHRLGASPKKVNRPGFGPPEDYDPCFSCGAEETTKGEKK